MRRDGCLVFGAGTQGRAAYRALWARCTRPSSRRIPFLDCIERLPEAPSRAAWHHVAQSRKAFSRSEGTGQQAFAMYGCLLLWARGARCEVRPGREWADGLRRVIAMAYLACGRGGTTLAKPCGARTQLSFSSQITKERDDEGNLRRKRTRCIRSAESGEALLQSQRDRLVPVLRPWPMPTLPNPLECAEVVRLSCVP